MAIAQITVETLKSALLTTSLFFSVEILPVDFDVH